MATPTIDYDALAKKAGAISSQPAAVDYSALAKQAGAISSTPGEEKPGALSRFGTGLYESTVGPAVQAISHPIDTAVGMAKQVFGLPELQQVHQHIANGDFGAGALKLLEYAQQGPQGRMARDIVQPMAQDVKEGNYAGAAGRGVGTALTLGAPELPKVVKGAGRAVAGAAERAIPKIPSTLNAVEQGAVDLLRENDVPLTPGTLTGNKGVKAVQATVQNSPLGATTAAEFNRGTAAVVTKLAGKLADQAHPEPVTPESAGRGISAQLDKNIEGLAGEARSAYNEAWKHQNAPAHIYDMPVRTDSTGGKIMKRVSMPVDVIDLKEALKPVFADMQWMPAADQASSAAFKAVKVILEGDDYISAAQAEKGLGGLKTMARVKNGEVLDAGQGIAASIIPELQANIDLAVGATGQDALQGLQKGRAAHASKMEVAEVAKQLRDEPVQAFQQATWKQDTGIDFLRTIAKQAPDQMAPIGRAFVQQLIEKATEGGGFNKTGTLLNKWNDLGPQTKAILFPDPELRANLGKFFKGADMVADNPNPSGTALVASATSVNPLRWVAGYLGSKLFFTPQGISLLTKKLGTQSPGAAALTDAGIQATAARRTLGQ